MVGSGSAEAALSPPASFRPARAQPPLRSLLDRGGPLEAERRLGVGIFFSIRAYNPPVDALIRPVGPPEVRASDQDREAVVEELRRHHSDGRLATDELEDRVGRAYQAKTMGELSQVVRDLPAPPPPPPQGLQRLRPYLGYGVGAVVLGGLGAGAVWGGVSGHQFAFPLPLIWVGFIFMRWRGGHRRYGSRWGGGPGPQGPGGVAV